MSLAVRVLIGLVTGFLLGIALSGPASPAAAFVVGIAAPLGTLFVNLIRMTVIPLLMSLVIASIGARPASGALGRLGLRALLISIVLLTVAAIASALIARPLLAAIPIDAAAALALRQGTAAADAARQPGSTAVAAWIVDLVPPNVIKAAADGAMLPVVLFSVLFGLTLTRIPDAKREPVLRVADGIAETMQRLVVYILQLAPVGVFALAVPLASTLGWSAAGAVAGYVALVVGLTVAAVAVLVYPLGLLFGPMPARTFISYCAPSQAIAFAARSSLAALPAMVQSAERAGLPESSSRVVMPLAMGVFHFGAAVAQTVGVCFLAHLYGVTLTASSLASVVAAVVLATFAVPGIPGGSIIAMTPALTAAGLPLEGLGILLAVDTLPDMFRTAANVTGAMTLAAILGPADRPDVPRELRASRTEPFTETEVPERTEVVR
jgi:Na+/H+-dicarboxylate symporter